MQFLEELRKILTYKIKNTIEIDDDNAAKLVGFILENVCQELAGRTFYIKTDHRERAALKRNQIIKSIKIGENDQLIMPKFGITQA